MKGNIKEKPHISVVLALDAVKDVEKILAEWNAKRHAAPGAAEH